MHIESLASAVFVLAFGSAFVLWMGLGAEGIAWMNLATSVPTCWLYVHLAGRCGVELNWRPIGSSFAFAALTAGLAGAAAHAASSPWANPWLRLLVVGTLFASIVAAFYGAFWTRLPYAAR